MSFDSASYPYDTVVYVTDTIGGLSLQASGVLISPDEVLTASHVVYSSSSGTASNIDVTPAYNMGSAPFGSATGVYFHYFQIQDPNDNISFQQSQFDYAVIHLSQTFAGLGTMGLLASFQGGLANVTGYPGVLNGQMETSQQNIAMDPGYTLFDGTSIGKGSSGGPVWVTNGSGAPYVVGVVSSSSGGPGSTGYFTQISTFAFDQIETWVKQDDAPTPGLAILDTTTGQSLPATAQPYTGPVAGLQEQYINATSDSLNISVSTPNWFIHSGSGNDAIAVHSGTNVLDGGIGSNFLSGGSGADTFFVDDRGPTADIWSAVVGFHASDAATIWGVAPQDFDLAWVDGQGAAGYTGLTLHATASGRPTASITLAGYTSADLGDGRLSVIFGSDPASGSTYMYIHGNS
jgi:V8-like Glu-specific endopeptidase